MLRSYSLDAQPSARSQQQQEITGLHLSANFLMPLCLIGQCKPKERQGIADMLFVAERNCRF